MGNLNKIPEIVVVHKGTKKNSKIYIDIFNNIRLDDIIDNTKKKPTIPTEHEILDIGVGIGLEIVYKKKYKL